MYTTIDLQRTMDRLVQSHQLSIVRQDTIDKHQKVIIERQGSLMAKQDDIIAGQERIARSLDVSATRRACSGEDGVRRRQF